MTSKTWSVKEILDWTKGRVVNADALEIQLDSIRVARPASLAGSECSDLAFFFSRAFEHELPTASPGVLIVGEPFVQPLAVSGLPLWKRTAIISCKDPYWAMAYLSEKFAPALSSVSHLPDSKINKSDIHSSAVIDPTAKIGVGVKVGAHCVVEEGAQIGNNAVLYPGCYVGPYCKIGSSSVLFSGVKVYEWTQVGERVRLHSNVVLGSDGFGYAPRIENRQLNGHQKIYHLGKVIIGDDVEIGANSCVDRATFGETRVEKNAKLDNLVHIGHNSQVGEGSIICGGTCLAGNASLGKYVTVGGLTGVGNHVHVGDGAKVGALAMVTKDVEPGGTAVGNPQREYREHFKAHALLSKLLTERRTK